MVTDPEVTVFVTGQVEMVVYTNSVVVLPGGIELIVAIGTVVDEDIEVSDEVRLVLVTMELLEAPVLADVVGIADSAAELVFPVSDASPLLELDLLSVSEARRSHSWQGMIMVEVANTVDTVCETEVIVIAPEMMVLVTGQVEIVVYSTSVVVDPGGMDRDEEAFVVSGAEGAVVMAVELGIAEEIELPPALMDVLVEEEADGSNIKSFPAATETEAEVETGAEEIVPGPLEGRSCPLMGGVPGALEEADGMLDIEELILEDGMDADIGAWEEVILAAEEDGAIAELELPVG